jgi:exopolyphosphatase/pppGpp-phosphohydrolase
LKVAAIDVGTNTVKLVVGERNADGLKLLAEVVLQPRIGEGVDETGFICSDAINRA